MDDFKLTHLATATEFLSQRTLVHFVADVHKQALVLKHRKISNLMVYCVCSQGHERHLEKCVGK